MIVIVMKLVFVFLSPLSVLCFSSEYNVSPDSLLVPDTQQQTFINNNNWSITDHMRKEQWLKPQRTTEEYIDYKVFIFPANIIVIKNLILFY